MDTHVRQLGNLSIVFGVVSTLAALIILLWFGGIGGLYNAAEDQGLGFLVVFSTLMHLLLGAPVAAAGYFVLRWQNWARLLMVVLCGVNILNPPFGSLLAMYGFWVLMRPETEPLFLDPPNRPRRPRPRAEM